MLSLENHLQDLNVSDDAYLEEACRQLEESWKSGTPPYFTTLKGYIPPGASQELRRALVIELTLTDIENRYHEDDIVKRYSEMFPELWTADFKDVLLGIYEKHFYLCQEHLHSPPEPIDYLRDVAPDLWPGLLPMLQPAWRFHYSPDSELFVETGMGRLFLARDLEIKRSVMVKELRHPQNPGARDLFDREIAITTELDHPGVIVVYGTRDEEDRKAFAMRLLTNDGRNGAKNGVALTLADKINELHHSDGKSRLTRRDYRILIHVLVSVCETVRFAHSKGIVHRDIKPTNIAVGEYGEVILLDWGLAKRLGISDRVDNVDNPVSGVTIDNTIAGDIKGTAAYMSPEQASGSYDLIDERTDVFNLGATLFHLLTGRSPYTGTPQECLGAALGRTFPRPRSLQPKIPKALEAICLKAMESYEQRYQTVECLKGDLSRWLADERLSTGGEGFREWSGRVLRRYSAAVCVGILSLLVLLLAVVWGNARIGKERDIARQERDRAQKEAAELMFSKGLSLCEQGYPRIGMLRMAEALSELGDASDPLEQTMRTNLATWSQRTPPLVAQFCVEGEDTDRIDGGPAILSDAHRMVTWHADDTFREWDLQSGNLVHKQPFGRPVGKVVPLHGARFAVVNHFDNNPVAEARIWDSQQGRFLGGRMTHAPRYAPKPVIETPSLYVTSPTGSSISSVAISADGTVGVTGTHDGVVTLWSLTDGAVNEVYSDVSDNTAVTNVAITDDGCLFAFVRGHRAHIVGLVPNSGSGLVEIRRVDDPQSESHHLRTSPPARAIEFGRQGQRFAIGSSDGHLLLLDSKTGKTVAQAMLAKGIDQVEFGSSGGRLLVRAGTVVRLYDAETGAYLDTEFRNEKGFESAAFSPDELLVATISGRTVQVWDAVNGKMYTSPFRFEKNVHSVAFADGGKLLVTAFSSEKTVEVRSWDLSVVASEHVIKLPNRLVLDTAFSPDGSRFAVTASEDVFLGRTADGSLTTQALHHDDSVYALAFTPDGRYLLTGDSEVKTLAQSGIFKSVTRNEGVRRWNTKTQKTEPPVFRTEASDTVYEVTSNTETVYAATYDGTVVRWDLRSGQFRGEILPALSSQEPERFRPTDHWGAVIPVTKATTAIHGERRLCARGALGRITLFQLDTGRELASLTLPDMVSALAFSLDGTRLATASRLGFAFLQEVGSSRQVESREIVEFPAMIESIAIGPNNRTVFIGGADGRARLYDTMTGYPVGDWMLHCDVVRSVAFHPQGKWVLTGTNSGVVRLWRIPGPIQGTPSQVMATIQQHTGMRLSNDRIPEWAPVSRQPAPKGTSMSQRDWHRRAAAEAEAIGQLAAARLHITHALADQPTDVELLRCRVHLSEQLEDYRAVSDDIARLVELLPEEREFHNQRHLALWRSGQFREYLAAIDAVDESSEDGPALLRRSVALVHLDRAEEADECYRHAVRLCPAVTVQDGVLWHERSGVVEPELWLTFANDCELVFQDGDAPWRLLQCRALAWGAGGKWKEAAGDLRRVLEVQPDQPEAWELLAWASRALEDWPETKQAATRALELHCEPTAMHYLRGIVQGIQKQWDAAAQDLSVVVETKPDCTDAWFSLGQVQLALGNYEQASESLEEAIRTGATHAFVRERAALAHAADGKWRDSVMHLQTLVDGKNENVETLQAYCIACLGAGLDEKYTTVVSRLSKMTAPIRSSQEANGLAWLVALGPSIPEVCVWAEAKAKQALDLLPKNTTPSARSGVLNTLGAVLVRNGRYQEAIKYLEESVELAQSSSKQAVNAVFLARAYQHLGRHDEAQRWLEQLPESDEILPPPTWAQLEQVLLIRELRASQGEEEPSSDKRSGTPPRPKFPNQIGQSKFSVSLSNSPEIPLSY